MKIEDEISLLKYQVEQLDKKLSALQTDFRELRDKFAGYNSQFAQVREILPIMQAKYQELSSKYDIRIQTIDKKLEQILKLTKENVRKDRPGIHIVTS